MNEFFTWTTLGTYAGATLAVALMTQLVKGIGWIERIPTRITSYVVALVVLLAASAVAGELTWATAGLSVINAVVVALAANGAYDGVTAVKTSKE